MKRLSAFFLALCLLLPLGVAGAAPLKDGEYTVKAVLSGGSGRASIASPAALTVEGGKPWVTVVWSSPYYAYMLVDGVRYEPFTKEGGAAFRIPVVFDEELPVQAQTVAMSEPHLVEYSLRFDSGSVRRTDGGALPLLYGGAAALLVCAGGWFALKKRSAKRA